MNSSATTPLAITRQLMACLAVASVAGCDIPPPSPPRVVQSMLEQRHDKIIIQKWDVSCGAAALASLLTYDLNYPVTERQAAAGMLRFTSVERVRAQLGFSLLDLKKFAESRGFVADGLGNMTLRDLVETGPSIVPIVLHGNNHFVIFRGMQGDRVLLADPAWGNRTMQIPNFMDMWVTRVAFTVSPPGSARPVHRMMARSSDFPASSPMFEGQANRQMVAALMDKPPSNAQMFASATPSAPLNQAAAGPGDELGQPPRTAAIAAMAANTAAPDTSNAAQRPGLPPAQPAGVMDTAPQVAVAATPLPMTAPAATPLPAAAPAVAPTAAPVAMSPPSTILATPMAVAAAVPGRVAIALPPTTERVAASALQPVDTQGVAAPLVTVQASPLPASVAPPVSRTAGPAPQGRTDLGGVAARQQAAAGQAVAASAAVVGAAASPVSVDDAWHGTQAIQDTVGVAPLVAVTASPLPLPPRVPVAPAGSAFGSQPDEHAILIAPTAPYGTARSTRSASASAVAYTAPSTEVARVQPAPAPTMAHAAPPAEIARAMSAPAPVVARAMPPAGTAPVRTQPAPTPAVTRPALPLEVARVPAQPTPPIVVANAAPNRAAPLVAASDEQQTVRAAKTRMLTAYANAFLIAGDNLLARGDVKGARGLYERAVQAGSARAAAALASTFDPNTLAEFGITNIQPDPAAAQRWYRTAATMGADGAAASLQDLR